MIFLVIFKNSVSHRFFFLYGFRSCVKSEYESGSFNAVRNIKHIYFFNCYIDQTEKNQKYCFFKISKPKVFQILTDRNFFWRVSISEYGRGSGRLTNTDSIRIWIRWYGGSESNESGFTKLKIKIWIIGTYLFVVFLP